MSNAVTVPADKLAELQRDHRRYEFVRTLNPRQWGELWQRNLRGEGPFDALVDAAMGERTAGWSRGRSSAS